MQSFLPSMEPSTGSRLCRFVGDRVQFRLIAGGSTSPPPGWRALLRTNLGRAETLRREILEAHTRGMTPAGGSWRDIPMNWDGTGWRLDLPLAEVGYFKAKAYALDARGWQHWPEGGDIGISVHPDKYRTANTVYCAFARLFGKTAKAMASEKDLALQLLAMDEAGYSVIPQSGKLRDLIGQLPHIVDELGCRILHLLPVNPTPTTYARFGRFGSPYAALDLTAVDPALVVFDKRSTGIDQFRELTYATHLRGAGVFLDIVINHTGWGSVLQERHPEWFLRKPDGAFASPGAWGVTWEDLVELKHQNVSLWDELSEIFLTWCERGVDGFRCDAGYMVPVPAWQYIVARVQQVYPETIFLLEGLGGAWESTEALLTEGGMQWAYSELFQNYSGPAVAGYLDHCLSQAPRVGLLVHYSETHDNERLAAKGRAWSVLRNRLCGLASTSGGFGFTCGVEWLANEKIRVHDRTSIRWSNPDNVVGELARLNQLLAEHPCFFDGAEMVRVSSAASQIYAMHRRSAEGLDDVLVLVNTSAEQPGSIVLNLQPGSSITRAGEAKAEDHARPAIIEPCQDAKLSPGIVKISTQVPELEMWVDLLGQAAPKANQQSDGSTRFEMPAAAAFCLSPHLKPRGLCGDHYREARARASWALKALSKVRPVESIVSLDWREMASVVDRDPARFLSALSNLGNGPFPKDFLSSLSDTTDQVNFPQVITWSLLDKEKITVVPTGHWLLIQDSSRFRAVLSGVGEAALTTESIQAGGSQVAFFPPQQTLTDATLALERYSVNDSQTRSNVRFVSHVMPDVPGPRRRLPETLLPTDLVLLTNGRGGMARLCVDLGRVNSKYDCVLGANLHPTLPVDRHVFAKRIRIWVNADGFLSALDMRNLRWFDPGPPVLWHFVANAGDGRTVEIQVSAKMIPFSNTTVFHFSRPTAAQASGKQLPDSADVRLTVRLDIEDRNFHWETKRNAGAEHHFSVNTHGLRAKDVISAESGSKGSIRQADGNEDQLAGFAFTPATDRSLRVFLDRGIYHPQSEWCENIPHPIEQSRAQPGSGDAYSPGWFEIPLAKGEQAMLVAAADPAMTEAELIRSANLLVSSAKTAGDSRAMLSNSARSGEDPQRADFLARLREAISAFVVNRGSGKTVIAGYPWFLDWGRDTFIAARGLLAAGMIEEVKQLVLTFAKFERDGTLPNTIFGEDATNRDTSDAPLWFGVVCEELGMDLETLSAVPGRNIRNVLQSIAENYIKGTPNGIRMDPGSALIWSPSHFTWMDTNYPACTPREGYPIEIQALWIRLLRQLAAISGTKERDRWATLATQATESVEQSFWMEEKGYYADVLLAKKHGAARQAQSDDALRSNCLFMVSLGLAAAERARKCVMAARQYLVVPGALRSLAPLKVSVPLANYGNDGRLLNNPESPYWGRYEGDEDTRRKPAYHNGTAWTWTFPVFCEALARAWNFSPAAVQAARAYLGTMDRLMSEGCLGQIPEIIDGNAPHTQRGCDAQAWGATEAFRVWKLLQ